MSKLNDTSCSGVVSETIPAADTFLDSMLETSKVSVTVILSIETKVLLTDEAKLAVVSNTVESSCVMLTITCISPSSSSSGRLATLPPLRVRLGPPGGLLYSVIPEKSNVSGRTGLLKLRISWLLS